MYKLKKIKDVYIYKYIIITYRYSLDKINFSYRKIKYYK